MQTIANQFRADHAAYFAACAHAEQRAMHSFFDQHVVVDEDVGYIVLDEGDHDPLPMGVIDKVVYTVTGKLLDQYWTTGEGCGSPFFSVGQSGHDGHRARHDQARLNAARSNIQVPNLFCTSLIPSVLIRSMRLVSLLPSTFSSPDFSTVAIATSRSLSASAFRRSASLSCSASIAARSCSNVRAISAFLVHEIGLRTTPL